MINFKDITKAIKTLFEQNLTGYEITRNQARNSDPNVAAKDKGWIGIYRNALSYDPRTTGNRPWSAKPAIDIEIQVADMDPEKAEDKLQDAEHEVLTLLGANKKLGDTVDMTNGYDVVYEFNADEQIYFHSAIITIKAEVRA